MIDASDQTVRYLLNTLSEKEREETELRLLTDDQYAYSVEAAQYELIDAYVRNELPLEMRRMVAQELLRGPIQLDALAVAQALYQREKLSKFRTAGTWRWSVGVAASIALVGGIGYEVWNHSRPVAPAPAVAAVVVQKPQIYEQSMLLTPGLVRSSSAKNSAIAVLKLLPQTTQVKFEVELPDGTPPLPLSARIDRNGEEAWKQSDLKHEGGGMTIEVDAKLFNPGAYVLTLNTVPSTQYFFELRLSGDPSDKAKSSSK